MNIHYLKTVQLHFEDIDNGKNCEIRKNDRNFQVDDILVLLEYNDQDEIFTSNWNARLITHICDYNQKEGVVVLSLEDVQSLVFYKLITEDTIKKMCENKSNKEPAAEKTVVPLKQPK